LVEEAGEMVYKSIPDDPVIDRIVAVDDTVSQADDEVDFVDFGLGFGIKVAETGECLADDEELPLAKAAKKFVFEIS